MSDRSSTCFWFKGLVYSKLSADVSRLGRGPCYDVVVCDLEPTQGGVGTREEPGTVEMTTPGFGMRTGARRRTGLR